LADRRASKGDHQAREHHAEQHTDDELRQAAGSSERARAAAYVSPTIVHGSVLGRRVCEDCATLVQYASGVGGDQ
jgi:hypothetical protein